jgi:hypothetical protein
MNNLTVSSLSLSPPPPHGALSGASLVFDQMEFYSKTLLQRTIAGFKIAGFKPTHA